MVCKYDDRVESAELRRGDVASNRRHPREGGRDAGLLWEDVESAANRTVKAPPKTWQKPAPRGIRRP